MTDRVAANVMLCDDSAAARTVLARILEADPDIRVTCRAVNGADAIAQIKALKPGDYPHVILLDLEMPVMDGMTAIPHLMGLSPRPAIIVASAVSQSGAAATMAAMRAGAVDYVPKPNAASGGMNSPEFRKELVAKVRGWARMHRAPASPGQVQPKPGTVRATGFRPKVVALGSSTGGPKALASLVRHLPSQPAVPIVAVQHMPAGFTTMLADHINRLGGPPCREVRDGEPILNGAIHLAPGDHHFLVERQEGAAVARLSNAPPENFCRPAVDPLLRSLVATYGGGVLAVILTGMGQDGLVGCRAVAAAGGVVLAQDEASSVVWGMPGAVCRAGLALAQLPPEALATEIRALLG